MHRHCFSLMAEITCITRARLRGPSFQRHGPNRAPTVPGSAARPQQQRCPDRLTRTDMHGQPGRQRQPRSAAASQRQRRPDGLTARQRQPARGIERRPGAAANARRARSHNVPLMGGAAIKSRLPHLPLGAGCLGLAAAAASWPWAANLVVAPLVLDAGHHARLALVRVQVAGGVVQVQRLDVLFRQPCLTRKR